MSAEPAAQVRFEPRADGRVSVILGVVPVGEIAPWMRDERMTVVCWLPGMDARPRIVPTLAIGKTMLTNRISDWVDACGLAWPAPVDAIRSYREGVA